ncbi:MAG: hypothetical protein EXR99_03250 [Gemmataceae bacterium]|nr:hypothetical protein [Gemmataceae bacterium]
MVLCQKDKSPGEGETVSYFKDIRPLFQQNCQGCHQPAKKQGGYLMVDYPSLFQKGDREIKSVVPGKPESSLLFGLITPKGNEKPEMPKGKDPLSKTQVELVRKWILQGAKDDSPKSVQKTVDPDHPPVYFLPPVITSLDYSPDGKTLAVSGYHEVLLHPSDGNGPPTRLIGLSERIESLAFSPDGKKLAVAGGSPGRFGEIQVWDLEKKKLALSAPTTHDTVYGVSWSPDGGKIAFGCADNTLRAIDSTTGQQLLFQGAHTDWVLGTTFSRDGLFLASISRDRSMKLTEVATQRFIDNITSITPGALKGGLHVVALKPSKEKTMTKGAEGTDSAEKIYEEILIGGSDGVPRVYKMHRVTKRVIGDDANKVREYEGIPGRICSGAFDKTGKLFAIGGSLDGKGYLRLYQTEDAKVLLRQDAGLGPIYTLAFHPQGNFLALGGFDGRVQILQIPSGQKVREFVPVPLSAGKN